MHLDDNTASLSYKDSAVPQLKGSVVTSLLLKRDICWKDKADNTLLSFIKITLHLNLCGDVHNTGLFKQQVRVVTTHGGRMVSE